MEAVEYDRLWHYESTYWWYVAQRENLVEAVRALGLSPGARVLDAGCGTGRNLREVSASLDVEGFGIDVSAHAAARWNGSDTSHTSLASVNEIPFANAVFDTVFSVDVLGCRGVDVEKSVAEIARVLRPGGHVVLLVPAYQWLLSRHDRAVHSVRRFTVRELRSLVESAGLTVERLTHRFMLLFPLIAGLRLWRKLSFDGDAGEAKSDLSPIPAWMNRWLLRVTEVERAWWGGWSLPFGSTILAVARKDRP